MEDVNNLEDIDEGVNESMPMNDVRGDSAIYHRVRAVIFFHPLKSICMKVTSSGSPIYVL
jgi:hypothetical protein